MAEWIEGSVIAVQHWHEALFSIQLTAAVASFTAGQFVKLGLEIDAKRYQRAYSYVNAPQNPILEFYLVHVPQGKLSSPLRALKPQDKILITQQASGHFTLHEIPDAEVLWMLATGTAIGPYLSILQAVEGLDRFQQIVLVHGVRYARDLSYWPLMQQLQQRYAGKLQLQAVTSRESVPFALHGRIPALIATGQLEAAVGLPLQAERSHVMLCGNPDMVRDTQLLLQERRDMRKHLRRQPGHISSERYW
ncbi:MAG: ferredoxin--NADP(+) reductase [Candidatus Symbiodolus clandestinus]